MLFSSVMEMPINILLLICAVTVFTEGSVFAEPLACGDWTPYEDEKCVKIVATAGHQTHQDSQIVCESFAAELHREHYPRLITVQSKNEQTFLQKFLFEDNKVLDHVWLGLNQVEGGTDFEWNDGSKLHFTNWADQTVTNGSHHCVEMESTEGITAAGQWVKVSCGKTNVVVCERRQTWSLETLQNAFLNYKFEQGLEMELARKKISKQEQRNTKAENEIAALSSNPVPMGFIYVQLPLQSSPATLWPQTKWTEISSSYAGLFFRVDGDKAAAFGQIQEASTSRLEQIEYHADTIGKDGCVGGVNVLPLDGSWTKYIYTGREVGKSDICLRFRLSNKEVRPRNQAVKVWQRTG